MIFQAINLFIDYLLYLCYISMPVYTISIRNVALYIQHGYS